MKVRLAALDGRLDALEQNVSGRFDTLEQSVSDRFGTLEQSVNGRFDEQGKKLDQIMLLLNTLIPKPE